MNVLFIAYHFPPIGGAGAQRSAKFVRYLPEMGVQPIVIGGPSGTQGRWEPADVSQVAEIPDAVPIYRPTDPPPANVTASRLDKVLSRASAREEWWQRQIAELGMRAVAEHSIDAIYVSLQPYEGLAAAIGLGRKFDLPVIADLRDPWALDEVRLYPTRMNRALDRRTMGRLLGECAVVIVNTPEATATIADAFPTLESNRLVTITNGYDISDFELSGGREPDGRFRIVHTGYLHSSLAIAQQSNGTAKRLLGGSLWSIDFLCRSHYYLLEAVSLLMEEDPDFASRIDIVLAGVLSDQDEQIIRESPARHSVRTLGYLDHHAAIEQMMSADVLFLPMHGIPDGRRARIVPGKTYEYLATGRPILAAIPSGDAKDFVLAANAGVAVDPSNVSAIADGLRTLADSPPPQRQVGEGVERFERRTLTEQLSVVLHSL